MNFQKFKVIKQINNQKIIITNHFARYENSSHFTLHRKMSGWVIGPKIKNFSNKQSYRVDHDNIKFNRKTVHCFAFVAYFQNAIPYS